MPKHSATLLSLLGGRLGPSDAIRRSSSKIQGGPDQGGVMENRGLGCVDTQKKTGCRSSVTEPGYMVATGVKKVGQQASSPPPQTQKSE